MTHFEGETSFHNVLVNGFGIHLYKQIMDEYMQVDVSANKEFQKLFNYFYKVRRNDAWREKFYYIFESGKKSTDVSFESILYQIYDHTNMVEPSFASKMLATLNSNMPIWDSKVLHCLGLISKGTQATDKLQNAVKIYDEIIRWYDEYMMTEDFLKNIAVFDKFLPDYKEISAVKKIDFMLWSLGDEN